MTNRVSENKTIQRFNGVDIVYSQVFVSKSCVKYIKAFI